MKYSFPYILILTFVLLTLSCNHVKLSDARDLYINGEYHKSSELYQKLYRNTPKEQLILRAIISYEMAEVNRKLNRSTRALTAYKNAIRYNYPDTLMYLQYAKMLHKEGNYESAVEAYNDFLMLSSDNLLAINGKLGAQSAKLWAENPARYTVKRADLLNSGRTDFSPVLTQNDEVIYFTSSREEATGADRSTVTGLKYTDIFISKKNSSGIWQKPILLESEINSRFDEGTPSVTYDGKYMFYTFSSMDTDKSTRPEIYLSRRINGIWTSGRPFEINNIDSVSIFAHPAVSPSGKYLYFVSDMPGGFGGKDIWRALLSHSFEVVTVENLGPMINTPGDEMFPYLRDDNNLYFSSDGHPGMGGLDLFAAHIDIISGNWQVENMKPPINSSQDDFGITFERKGDKGFFSSNREDVRGYDHIYSFEYQTAKIKVEGFAVDQEDKPVMGVTVSIVGSDGSQRTIVTNLKGEYQFEAERNESYVFMAVADGYLNSKQELQTTSEEIDTVYFVDFELVPYNKPVILENIFYDFNSATLRSESKTELNKLVELLKEYPDIYIELSAHSDRFGDDEYNIQLSTERAQSVINYLTVNGIEGKRLKATGYGKSYPILVNKSLAEKYDFLKEGISLTDEFIKHLSPNQQEIADQLNRRTDFMVLNPKEIELLKTDSPK